MVITKKSNGMFSPDKYIDYRDLVHIGWFYIHEASGKTFYKHIYLDGQIAYAERV